MYVCISTWMIHITELVYEQKSNLLRKAMMLQSFHFPLRFVPHTRNTAYETTLAHISTLDCEKFSKFFIGIVYKIKFSWIEFQWILSTDMSSVLYYVAA